MKDKIKKQEYNAIFLSDLHLGTKYCQAKNLYEFLRNIDVKEIYLLGDIVDISALRRKFFWDKHHNAVLRQLFKLAQKGCKITYIPGNHDVDINEFVELDFAGIKIANETIYHSLGGEKYLLLHGDKFDGVLNEKLWFLYSLGDHCYSIAMMLNAPFRWISKNLWSTEWSLSAYLKNKVKNVVKFINNFEHLLVTYAKANKVNGVICGHIHTSADTIIDDIRYLNCGCWTESASIIAEYPDGVIKLIDHKDMI